MNNSHLALEAGFTPDSSYVVSGSQDGTVHVWSAETGEKVTVLDGGHPGPTFCTQFNPKLMMMASACSCMVSGEGEGSSGSELIVSISPSSRPPSPSLSELLVAKH